VFGDQTSDRAAAEPVPSVGGEQGLVGQAAALLHPYAQNRDGVLGEGSAPLLAAFSLASDVGAGAQFDVAVPESGELGDSQAGLHGDVEQGVVSPSGPGAAVGGVQQDLDLGVVEVGDVLSGAAFGWDVEHAGDERCVLGMPEGGVAEERADGGQAGVAGAGTVVAFLL